MTTAPPTTVPITPDMVFADQPDAAFEEAVDMDWLTSWVPTTLAPTTLAPTTLAPTTLPPTTLPPTTYPPQGSVCWGHDTGVVELNIRDFFGNWAGTGVISDPGAVDTEAMLFDAAEEMISETWHYGVGRIKITKDKYAAGFGAATIEYKNGATIAVCEADIWHAYVGSFICSGFVKVRVTG